MDFPREEMLEKYARLREQLVEPYKPDFDTSDDEVRYVRFNDAWRGLNPYSKFLLPRLMNRKNTFPKIPSKKLAKNADPDNYVTLYYDGDGKLKKAWLGRDGINELVTVYVSEQLSISYWLSRDKDSITSYDLFEFEWCEYDDLGRLVSVEEFQCGDTISDDVKINCEYYEYAGDVLSHAWCFQDFQKFPMQMTMNMVFQFMPDRILNPEQIEYSFCQEADGLDYTRNHFFRKSQTITDKGHISEETLSHLEKNGFRLI